MVVVTLSKSVWRDLIMRYRRPADGERDGIFERGPRMVDARLPKRIVAAMFEGKIRIGKFDLHFPTN